MAECPICYECMNTRTTKKLKCGHAFHKHCIDRWAQEQCTCPYCRKRFGLTNEERVMTFFAIFLIVWYTYVFLLLASYS